MLGTTSQKGTRWLIRVWKEIFSLRLTIRNIIWSYAKWKYIMRNQFHLGSKIIWNYPTYHKKCFNGCDDKDKLNKLDIELNFDRKCTHKAKLFPVCCLPNISKTLY